MPKIFLIKNRLHQQQLRLAEAHKRAEDGGGISLSPPGSPLSYQDAQPLPLIVSKDHGKQEHSGRPFMSHEYRVPHLSRGAWLAGDGSSLTDFLLPGLTTVYDPRIGAALAAYQPCPALL